MLKKLRGKTPEDQCATLDALIEDLTKGHGAAQKRGGDRRSEKAKADQNGSTPVLNGSSVRGKSAKSPSSLAARLAESTDEKAQQAWKDYLHGKHRPG